MNLALRINEKKWKKEKRVSSIKFRPQIIVCRRIKFKNIYIYNVMSQIIYIKASIKNHFFR